MYPDLLPQKCSSLNDMERNGMKVNPTTSYYELNKESLPLK
jgi:hypothetical protein